MVGPGRPPKGRGGGGRGRKGSRRGDGLEAQEKPNLGSSSSNLIAIEGRNDPALPVENLMVNIVNSISPPSSKALRWEGTR